MGEALGGCSPPLGGRMGCMQPHTSDDWVSPGDPPPMMLLDIDIKQFRINYLQLTGKTSSLVPVGGTLICPSTGNLVNCTHAAVLRQQWISI